MMASFWWKRIKQSCRIFWKK